MPALYFPEYWRNTRRYARKLAPLLHEHASAGGLQASNRALYKALFDEAATAGLNLSSAGATGVLAREAMGAQTIAAWQLEGQKLFHASAELVAALRRSDCGDMQLADVLRGLPEHVYIHFGAQEGWLLGGRNALVEGALIVGPLLGHYRLLLVGRDDLPWTNGAARHFMMLKLNALRDGAKSISEAIDAALSEDIEDIEKSIGSLVAENGEERLSSQGAIEDARAMLEHQRANGWLYRQAIELIAGILAYSTYYPDDVGECWQPDVGPKWLARLAEGGKRALAQESKLRSNGFQRVTLIGKSFSLESAQESRSVTPHWRKGHWRAQAHGPLMSLRKLIWIRPVRVLGSV